MSKTLHEAKRALDLSGRSFFDAVVEELHLPQLVDWAGTHVEEEGR